MGEVEVITATADIPVEQSTKIGTPGFIKQLLVEFQKKKVWRTLTSLSAALHVDPKQLSDWLDSNSCYVRRAGKEARVFYYAWTERLGKEVRTSSEKIGSDRVVREEDGYALGMLHMVYFQLYKVLKTYGLEISQKDAEAFGNLTVALDKLESGLLLFSNKIKASMDKLPKFR
jgi:hypothetical protein